MIFASRPLFLLGLIGAAVGVLFGVKGMLAAHEAVSEVNRKGGDAASLFRADPLETALDKVRAKVGADGKLLQLNVYPATSWSMRAPARRIGPVDSRCSRTAASSSTP